LESAEDRFSFHTTASEKRILRELGEVARIRGVQLPDAGVFSGAAECISRLNEILFPQESRLLAERERLLKPLNSGPLRVHFDRSLESPALTLQAKVRDAADYAALLGRLGAFDFETWARHCEEERSDAD
jgi:hypothetical protein